MSNTFIQEAFKQFYLTEDAEEFSLNVSGPDDVESFLDIVAPEEDEEVISDVYDLEAEAKEDLKQSYLGKVILDCNVCHSNVFFDKDEITENEDGLCCVEIECPYCMSNEGYTIIGEVKPYQEEGDVDIEDIETEEVPEEPVDDVEVDVEETEEEPEAEEEVEEELEEGLNEALNLDTIEKGYLAFRNEDEYDTAEEFLKEHDYDFFLDTASFDDEKCRGKFILEGLKADEVKELRGDEEINGADGPIAAVDELEGSDEIRGPKYAELNEGCEDKEELEECGDPEAMEEGIGGTVAGKVAGRAVGSAIGGPVGGMVGSFVGGKLGDTIQDTFTKDEELEEGMGATDLAKDAIKGVANEITEDIEDVSINTEDENITMTTKEDGGVVVETSPKEDAVVEDEVIDDAEMIAPLEPETEADIEDAVEMNDEEEASMDDFDLEDIDLEGGEEDFGDDFEEFDEESFDNLGESYLKRCYENVTSFKTSNITLNENKEFIIEGKIGFDSGNEKDTQFIFSKKSSEDGKLKLEGYNKQISNGKKTFKLNCSINDKALICESLNYNYKGKNDLNESVRVYGTVKRK